MNYVDCLLNKQQKNRCLHNNRSNTATFELARVDVARVRNPFKNSFLEVT